MSDDAWWTLLAALAMVVGVIGVVIPVVPGLLLIWAAALVYGLAVGFGWVGLTVMVALTALSLISVVKGFTVPKQVSEAAGASGWSQLGAVIGAVIGMFVIPLVGLVVGALVGVVVVELVAKRNWPDAWRATKGMAKGFGLSTLIDLGLANVMIMLWAVWAITVLV